MASCQRGNTTTWQEQLFKALRGDETRTNALTTLSKTQCSDEILRPDNQALKRRPNHKQSTVDVLTRSITLCLAMTTQRHLAHELGKWRLATTTLATSSVCAVLLAPLQTAFAQMKRHPLPQSNRHIGSINYPFRRAEDLHEWF